MVGNILRTTYFLNKSYRIVDASNMWNQFAVENVGEGILLQKILECPIWDFVLGKIIKAWFEALLQFVGLRKEKIESPYRCNSPELQVILC